MTDSGDRPLPPSYEEVMKNASAPPVLDVDQPTHPSQPSYLSYPGGGQPPYLSGTQPPYPSPNQVPYHGVGQQPYPSAGQGPYPYQNAPGGPNYAYPPQAPYGSQPGPMPFNQQPGHPAQYTHSMVTAAPANVAVGSAGYQTTPMAYGNTYRTMEHGRSLWKFSARYESAAKQKASCVYICFHLHHVFHRHNSYSCFCKELT